MSSIIIAIHTYRSDLGKPRLYILQVCVLWRISTSSLGRTHDNQNVISNQMLGIIRSVDKLAVAFDRKH